MVCFHQLTAHVADSGASDGIGHLFDQLVETQAVGSLAAFEELFWVVGVDLVHNLLRHFGCEESPETSAVNGELLEALLN